MEEALKSVELRMRGSALRFMQMAIPKKFQQWQLDSGKEWGQLLFDLEIFEKLKLPGVRSWEDLVCLKSYFGLDPFAPGSVELRIENKQTIKFKPSLFVSPSLFSDSIPKHKDVSLKIEKHHVWVIERSIGFQGNWKSNYTETEIIEQKFIQYCRFYLSNEQFMLIRPVSGQGSILRKIRKKEENLIRGLSVL
jgi:hypothetical protein